MEEDFGPQKSFIAHINGEGSLRNVVDSIVHFDPLLRVRVIFEEFLLDVRANVAELFLKFVKILEK
jgi:hypothetical protein